MSFFKLRRMEMTRGEYLLKGQLKSHYVDKKDFKITPEVIAYCLHYGDFRDYFTSVHVIGKKVSRESLPDHEKRNLDPDFKWLAKTSDGKYFPLENVVLVQPDSV